MRFIDRLLDLAVVSVALISVLPLFSRAWWVFELFSHFRVQYLVFSALLLLMLLARRRAVWAAALVPFACLNAVPVYSSWSSEAAPESLGETVSVMNINVNAENTELSSFLRLVREESPDIIVFLELSTGWRRALRPLAGLYPHRIESEETGRFGLAVLSRLPLLEEQSFDLLDTPALSATFELDGQPMRIVGVHLRPPVSANYAATRNGQLEELGKLAQSRSEPLLIVGDFNLTTYSPVFARWLDEHGLRSATRPQRLSISWPTFLPLFGVLIDHYVVSDEIIVDDFHRGREFGSDHYPLTAEISLRGSK